MMFLGPQAAYYVFMRLVFRTLPCCGRNWEKGDYTYVAVAGVTVAV